MKKYSLHGIETSSCDLEDFLTRKSLYVDKTKLMADLILDPNKFLMFVRPRRMGKSLSLNVIKSLYEGKKHLFAGTWIEMDGKEYWKDIGIYPVITINAPCFPDNGDINQAWVNELRSEAEDNEVFIRNNVDPHETFRELIKEVARKSKGKEKKCVILVDEYDRPLTTCMGAGANQAKLEAARSASHNTYSILKDLDTKGWIKKCIFTGSAKFAKQSIFQVM